jgi:small-conductance mechanosensitive channel
VTIRLPYPRRTVFVALVAALWVPPCAVLIAQPRSGTTATSQSSPPAVQDPEAEGEPAAPVLVGGEPVIWISTGAGGYTPQVRADRIGRRLSDIVHDPSITDPAVTVNEVEGSSELRVGPRLVMVVTPQDATSVGVARPSLAAEYARQLEAAIRAERLRYAPETLVRSAISAVIATLVFGVLLWVVYLVTRWARGRIDRWQARISLRVQQAELVSAEGIGHALDRIVLAIRIVVFLLLLNLYLTFVLGLFPWTRAASLRLLSYLITPLETVAAALIGYLPNLVFVIVIAGVIYMVLRLVRLFFQQVEQGRIAFANFPVEWADPTYKIVRVLLIAFGLVVAFPYLPASDSAAFAGVSVFIGVLVSLSSSSAIANVIAGIALTYTNAFRLGDRVKLGDSFGDIVETSLLATRIRTIKNEHITIPNSIVLGSAITNFSRNRNAAALILHTSVTIGYDAPWRQVHELLIGAALSTPGLRDDPRPFVLQMALNDFYVTYEINAYTDTPHEMVNIYAALHARIQDVFYAAGVEIMSPHYTSVRDGNTVAIPEGFRAPGYQAPAFRVESVGDVVSRRS